MKKIFDCYMHGQCNISLPDHTTCGFGKFYFGKGKELFGNDPLFKALAGPHENVHRFGLDIFNKIKTGKKAGLDEAIEELDRNVNNLVRKLDELADKYR
jgi:hypothetical protein